MTDEKKWELERLIIDLVWSATDGGTKLLPSSFSHFDEELMEMKALKDYINTSHALLLKQRDDLREAAKEVISAYRKTHGGQDAICLALPKLEAALLHSEPSK